MPSRKDDLLDDVLFVLLLVVIVSIPFWPNFSFHLPK